MSSFGATLPSSPQNSDSLSGVLERIIFFNEENNFTIAELRPETGKDKVTILGPLGGVQCGETLSIQGAWSKHPTHGPQFKIQSFESRLPASIYGIRKYLGSGLVKGVSKGLAERIVKRFGSDTLRVISEESARLQEVSGIGKQRARSIKEAWDEQVIQRELFIFGQTYGLTPSLCLRVFKQFGTEAVSVLQNEPYRAAREVHGVGFKTADKIAINTGVPNDSPQRIDAGIEFVLQELQDEGHTAFPIEELANQTSETLDTDVTLVQDGIERLLESKSIWKTDSHNGIAYAQLPHNFFAEEKIANAVRRLKETPSGLPPIKREIAVDWAQEKAGFEFGESQKEAVKGSLAHKVFILTGGPGTGKTTILRAVVSILKAKKAKILLAAPTGRAAQRLSESTRAYAQTIHRLLKFDPAQGGFVMNENKPLSADVVIVDEASMLDARLAAALFQAIPSKAHLILVGDVDQLPSVGAGNVLKDLIASRTIRYVTLDVVFRQKKFSSIVHYAHAINRGEVSLPTPLEDPRQLDPKKDFQFLAASDQQDAANKVAAVFKDFIAGELALDPISDAQTLAPMHKGLAGVGNLNQTLQETLNTRSEAMPFGSLKFKVGDKVIQTRNNYDKNVFNGDIGIVKALDGVNGLIDVDFDGTEATYDKSEMIDLQLAYAVSIHKSQGSEYPVVVIPLLKAHFMMLQRNLIYTAVTRGKKKIVIVGESAAYAMAVRNSDAKSRCTLLQEFLR
ncbi:ATP-dependent RecD-like DNA helicase [Pelagicoccus sp. SDUM812003]|uniref:SF1B family DNA helicase RecD2 n=1 Tax=Pelagicoccus sp. SDUM812003 TaxID=3041267 RepID=UPI00280E00AA|nr:ATP-dependent RecD-like DNA helicase [Pelagicoccus sp. SDUM812003]MDQ8205554.1 ATP-dependent RecD-like DNA helicase [Pelagicoccus sp. SDUM812003]